MGKRRVFPEKVARKREPPFGKLLRAERCVSKYNCKLVLASRSLRLISRNLRQQAAVSVTKIFHGYFVSFTRSDPIAIAATQISRESLVVGGLIKPAFTK